MPPGWDGLKTAVRLWELDAELQIVICTAYSDHSWQELRQTLARPDSLVILRKPFDPIEVLQLAEMLSEKWRLARQTGQQMAGLERVIHQRTHELQDSQASLEAAKQRLLAATEHEQQALTTQVRYRRVLHSELQQALAAGDITVHYQPLIDTATQRIVSLEALVRWQHPKEGFISPATFIPVAEESGLIVEMGEFVLKTVCNQVARWRRAGIAVVPVAVNVSAVQLQRVNMWKMVRRVLREADLSPQWLALEITESSLLTDARSHLKHLHGLRRDGVRILLDDFGTGYSSLSYLKHLPIDTLKIDRSFISQLDVNARDETIVNAIVSMAHGLGFKVVAEGVETAAQFAVLRRLGCDVVQGFLFHRPLTTEACGEVLGMAQHQLGDNVRSLPAGANVYAFPKLATRGDR